MNSKITAPAIGLMALGCAGALQSVPVLALGMLGPEVLEPMFTTVEQALREALQDQRGHFQRMVPDQESRLHALAWGGLFLGLNVFITWAGYRMLGRQSWTLAVVASVLAMVTCLAQCSCCPIGVPVGLWALTVLLSADGKRAFESGAKA